MKISFGYKCVPISMIVDKLLSYAELMRHGRYLAVIVARRIVSEMCEKMYNRNYRQIINVERHGYKNSLKSYIFSLYTN